MVRKAWSISLHLLLATLARADGPQPNADLAGDALPRGVLARLGSARLHHDGAILGVAIAKDGQMVASCGDDFTTRLWDRRTGKELRRFWQTLTRIDRNSAARLVHCVTFSPDGKTLAAGIDDGVIRLWDATSGKEIRKIATGQAAIHCLCFSPDGKLLASSGAERSIKFWDTSKGTSPRQLVTPDMVSCLQFSLDGKALASGGGDGAVRLWDTATGKETRMIEAHKGNVRSLAFLPDGLTLASAGADGLIRLWDVASASDPLVLPWGSGVGPCRPATPILQTLMFLALSREKKLLTGHQAEVCCLAAAPDGKTLISGSLDRTVRFWDVTTGQLRRTISGDLGQFFSVACSADSKTVISSDDRGALRIWAIANGEELTPVPAPYGPIQNLAFARNGKTLWCSSGTECYGYSVTDGKPLGVLKSFPHGTNAIALSEDGDVAQGTTDGDVIVRDAASGKEVRRLPASGGPVHSLTFAHRRSLLLVGGSNRSMCYWQGDGDRQEKRLFPVPDDIIKVAVAENGRLIAGVGARQTIYIRNERDDLEPRKLEETGVEVDSLAFSPDGRLLAVGSQDGIVRLWETATGKLFQQLTDHPGSVTALAFSRDGKILVAGSWLTIRFWELATKRECLRLDAQPGAVLALSFAPSGCTLAAAHSSGNVLIHDVAGRFTTNSDRPPPLSDGELMAQWEALADENPYPAYRAAWTLISSPSRTVPFLGQHLHAGFDAHDELKLRIAKWVGQLDSDDFNLREEATAQLAKIGSNAEPEFQKALAHHATPELRRRIQELRQQGRHSAQARERLRATRAVAILEQIGSTDALELLKSLASGEGDAQLTIDVGAALERLKIR